MKTAHTDLPNSRLVYSSHLFPEELADNYLEKLLKNISWKQEKIKLFGKERLQPRLSAFFGERELSYTYSGLKLEPENFLPEILEIKKQVESFSENSFNSCLANLYRDGKDSMGWHADDEKELGENPVIASVSFGADRNFNLKHKKIPDLKRKILLSHGSLLLMKGETQHFWKHQLPKTKKSIGPRINLTFRNIKT